MNTFDFEEEVVGLEEDLAKLKEMANKGEVDLQKNIDDLESKIKAKKREIYDGLNGWQRVQVSRHPERPYTLYYIEHIFDDFIELHGDRNVQDDKAIVGGLAKLDGQSVMVIGHQKGINTKMRQYRNFGMANPEGYRKALRLMKLAEKFDIPIISLVDTPGAFPGLEAEERGQGEAIARNIYEMFNLTVPIVVTVIGEGASGGAIGIGVGDRVMMLENTWYSVISPESCSSILWRSWDYKETAAEQLKLSAKHMKDFGLIDRIISEPAGGAHSDPEKMADILKAVLAEEINQLQAIDIKSLKASRIEKFSKMGEFDIEK